MADISILNAGESKASAKTEGTLKVARNHKVWIDLDNSPHVPFFAPISEELQKRGYSVFITARDCFQVCDLANLFNLTYKKIGRHYGKNKILKLTGLCFRATQMLPTILRERPSLALSHGSRAQVLLSTLMGIPTVTIFDYEYASQVLLKVRPGWVMVPEVIPDDAVKLSRQHVLTYPGIKEDVYVPRFQPDPSIQGQLGLKETDVVVTLRPPAVEAHYHNPQSDELFEAVVDLLGQKRHVKVVLLPRNERQASSVRKLWPGLFATQELIIPERVVDGLNLIWYSDLVISGGGTMNREAAALGVPVYSIFRGKIGAVDQYLAASGRLTLLESVDDVRNKIPLVKRHRPAGPKSSNPTALRTIVDHVVSVMESKCQERVSQNAVTGEFVRQPFEAKGPGLDLDELTQMAVKGLERMFDSEKQLFCFRLKQSEHGLVREGLSHRYTLMSLLGLHKIEKSPIDVGTALDALLRTTTWVDNIGDLGLLLWLCALDSPERLEEVCSKFEVRSALSRYPDARQARTMELAWFLSGLAHATLSPRRKISRDLTELAFNAYDSLKDNQGGSGIFGHLARKRSMAGRVRGHIGSFADQVYPIYALARFAQAYNHEEALQEALKCTEAICRVQGTKGQWWWHYNSSTGRVLQRYPVYAVHQHGMGPMALFAVGEAAQLDFTDAIYRGLRWITGKNELSYEFRDASASIVWRSIYRKPHRMYLDEILSLVRFSEGDGAFEVKRECRPYELGWLLYAFGDSTDEGHV